jgi:hypothetical protein
MYKVVECNINLNITIPKGILYYPCCGADTQEPIKLFLNYVDQFHFADIDNISLPAVEGKEGRNRLNKIFEWGKFCGEREGELLLKPHWFVEKSIVYDIDIKKETLDFKMVLSDDECLPENPAIYQEIWSNSCDGFKTEVFCHCNDGIITLFSLDKLSVFFYRGDSIGEGGSGQWWLGPNLFNFVLDKLLDDGLIITDGSNPDPMFRMAEWSPFWNEKKDFVYRGRNFKCLGQIAPGATYVWQVKRL